MPKFIITEVVQQINCIEVFAESKEAVEENYWNGDYNEALDKDEGDMSVVSTEFDEAVEPAINIDFSQFIEKDDNAEKD